LGIGMQAEMRYSKQLWPLWVLSSCCSLSRRDLICHRDHYLKRLSVIRRNYILAPWKRKRRLLSRDLLPTCHLNTGRKESVQVCNEKSNADIPETIFALSTPPGRAALAVIRVSGTQSLPLLRRLSKSNETIDFSPRKLIRRRIVDPCTVSFFFFGQSVVTFQRALILTMQWLPISVLQRVILVKICSNYICTEVPQLFLLSLKLWKIPNWLVWHNLASSQDVLLKMERWYVCMFT